ncbi:MAG TPA: hypothetical protein VFF98_07725 [Novosphingobium sp.]|nr:hypothetical protein [Novosphingobium sp.]
MTFIRLPLARLPLARWLAGLALAALPAACHTAPTKSDDQRTAGGQVLKGSASDGMIPYEALTSEPPMAPRIAPRAAEATSATAADAATAQGTDAAPPQAPAPAPGFSQ